MRRRSFLSRAVALILAGSLLLSSAARAAEIRVVSSGGFAAVYKALAPEFEKKTGDKLLTEWGPSMGDTPQAVPARLKRGEPIDVLIMVGYALGDLVRAGKGRRGQSRRISHAQASGSSCARAPPSRISAPSTRCVSHTSRGHQDRIFR